MTEKGMILMKSNRGMGFTHCYFFTFTSNYQLPTSNYQSKVSLG